MLVLGIESSCDETAAAIYDGNRGLLSHQLYSQVAMHAEYGGVVPELASRDHIRKLLPLIQASLDEAQVSLNDIEGIAYTKGPGLVGALLVGATLGRSLAWALNIPSIGVHHMEAHLLAVMLEENPPEPPFVALLVSGGHTQLVKVEQLGDYRLLGESLDDAVGEAFDKTAKLLGLPYPGGPELARLAQLGQHDRFDFPRPMVQKPGLDFSFSGLKTHAMNCYRAHQDEPNVKADIAYAFEQAVVDTLAIKCRRALDQTYLNRLVVVGGVSANITLRHRLRADMTSRQGEVYFPGLAFCTDNAAMVAYTGHRRLVNGEHDVGGISVKTRWPIAEI